MKNILAFALVLPALLAAPASSVFAHVVADPNQGKAGGYFQTSLRITHGCDGSGTKSVSVKIPDGVLSVRPQFKPGWKIDIVKVKLPKPVQGGHGKMIEEAVSTVTWSGNLLPESQYDEFGLIMKLPAQPGETLWFPVTQVCESGENLWNEIPAKNQQWRDLHMPAPFVKLTPATP